MKPLGSEENASRDKLKLLVDTCFLLSALGVEVEREVLEAIGCFHLAEVYYVEACLLEAVLTIMEAVSAEDVDVVRRGLESVKKSYNLAIPPLEAYIEAYEMYLNGHEDYVDNLAYSTSKSLNLTFLTDNEEFIDFLKENGYSLDLVMTPRELINNLRG